MAAITPLAGLLKWCILSPLQLLNEDIEKEDCSYAKLHLGLLESLREAGPTSGPIAALSVQHIANVIPLLQVKITELLALGRKPLNEPCFQVRLIKFLQSLHKM